MVQPSIMQYLTEKFRKKLLHLPMDFQRSLMQDITWEARLIGIKGARGAGKTTLLLQRIKTLLDHNHKALYVSMDDLWFADHRLTALADQFAKEGGRYLFIDEVHKYPDWSRQIKNIYDDYPELYVIFTGSSLLEILNARADLSRRAVVYEMQGLSFREYLHFSQGQPFPRLTLPDLLSGHETIASEIVQKIRPLAYFKDYLKAGYYPFFKEVPILYPQRLTEVVNLILEIELPQLRRVDIAWIHKLRQLLLIIAESAPFKPNISALSNKIGINRETLLAYLHHLSECGLTRHLYREGKGISRLQKPDKVYLDNTNLAYTLRPSQPDTGTIRETYFANQLAYQHKLSYPKTGDFLVDGQHLFEIGGPGKSGRQLPDTSGFLALDNIEFGYQNRIPLWLFGFLY